MTPKENAKELVNNVGKIIGKELKKGGFKYNIEIAKLCALKTVEEIMKLDVVWYQGSRTYDFYEEVKQEIEKL
jgi:hypothetical protein